MKHSCGNCKYVNESENGEHCNGCKQNATDKFEQMTNADRIRSMSDAEMARFISRAQADRAKFIICGQITKFPFGECEWLEWLHSPVEV